MQPDFTPEKPQQQKSHGSRRTDSASPNLQHPDKAPSRNREEHSPLALCFHDVSAEALDILLAKMLPELVPDVAKCLHQAIVDSATIPHNALVEGYFDLTSYSISQFRKFRLGCGPAEEREHRIIIQRHTAEEPCVFELSLSKSTPRTVDFKILYTWMEEGAKWDNVNEWGALVGIESLSSLFSNTPPELFEYDRFGCCTSLVTGDISIRTQQVSSEEALSANMIPKPTTSSHWIPVAIQMSAPSYGEQREIIRTISPQLGGVLVETGLLPTIDAFCERDAELQTRLLDRASDRLSCEVTIEFVRLVNLGSLGNSQMEHDDNPEALWEETDSPLPYSEEDEPHEEEHLESEPDEDEYSDEEDKTPFSAYPLQDLPVSSSVYIDLFSNSLGMFRLECLSTAQQHGDMIIDHTPPYNFAVPTIGVTFFDDTPSLRELASRWRLMRQIARVEEEEIDRKQLEGNLFLSAVTPNGEPVSADIGIKRILMSFYPPSNTRSDQNVPHQE